MASGESKSVLCVESVHDCHVVISLMKRHGVEWRKGHEPIEIKICDNDLGVLNAIRDEVDAAIGNRRSVGFLIDIDTTNEARWKQVRERLKLSELLPPDLPTVAGYIEERDDLLMKVGAWLMPDNQLTHGSLEDFLESLIPSGDALFEFAKKATDDSKSHGAKFADPVDRKKANLHCWLAWQKEPGTPYGQAINFHYLEQHSGMADAFVAWFKRLYNIA